MVVDGPLRCGRMVGYMFGSLLLGLEVSQIKELGTDLDYQENWSRSAERSVP